MSYFRGKYYTYKDIDGPFYMFGLGFVPKKWVDAFVIKRFDEMSKEEIECVRNRGCPCCKQSMKNTGIKDKLIENQHILNHINYWRNHLVESAWCSKKIGYDNHECCGTDGADISFTKRDFEALVLELKQPFMNKDVFKEEIKKSGLIGFKFPIYDNNKNGK